MVSLLVFPSAIRPLLMENLLINDEEYDRIISERKEIIINMLFKKLKKTKVFLIVIRQIEINNE